MPHLHKSQRHKPASKLENLVNSNCYELYYNNNQTRGLIKSPKPKKKSRREKEEEKTEEARRCSRKHKEIILVHERIHTPQRIHSHHRINYPTQRTHADNNEAVNQTNTNQIHIQTPKIEKEREEEYPLSSMPPSPRHSRR